MLKRLYRLLPFLMVSLFFTTIKNIVDGIVYVRMMGLLDLALNRDSEGLEASIATLVIMALLLVPIGVIDSYFNGIYKRKGNITIKNYYIEKVFKKNIAEFQKENNAKYISTMTNDCNTLETNLVESLHTVVGGFSNFLVGVWILSTVNPWLILLSLVVTAINIIVSKSFSKPIKKVTKDRSDLFDGFTSYIKEVLSAFHIIKNNNLNEKITKDYYEKSSNIQHKGYVLERLYSYVISVQQLFMGMTYFGVLCVMGYYAVLGKITPASLLLITEGIQRMARPLFQITENLPKLFTAKSLIDKIENTLVNADDFNETKDMTTFRDSILINDVSFRYEDDEKTILSHINLELKKNGKYLIVGPSGGGKSTLLKLLRKYYKPTSGEILVDGVNLSDIKKEQYFSIMTNVEQQVFLFEDTLRNNITLYKEYTDEEIKKAITAAGLTQFVEGLKDGLDTIIYDNGKNISGGERSRVVIARAMLAKSNILFLDEAFASLDLERAREIEKTILSLNDITVINVSHVIFQDTKIHYDKIINVKGTLY